MLNVALGVLLSTVFAKEIGVLRFLQYEDYKNIFLFSLCFDLYFFISFIVLHHGDNNFLFYFDIWKTFAKHVTILS